MTEVHPSTETVLDVCDACAGTGIEEGREWDGQPCLLCKGKKFIPIADGPVCPACGPTDQPCEHVPTAVDFL
jgi:hypothetical protein